MSRVIGRSATTQARMLTVVRDPYHVTVHDHPDPQAHAGWTMHTADAKKLAELLLKAASDEG